MAETFSECLQTKKKPDTLVFINNYNYDDTNKHKHTKQNCDRAGPEGRVGENSVGGTKVLALTLIWKLILTSIFCLRETLNLSKFVVSSMCHVSGVMCHMSPLLCHLSPVTSTETWKFVLILMLILFQAESESDKSTGILLFVSFLVSSGSFFFLNHYINKSWILP